MSCDQSALSFPPLPSKNNILSPFAEMRVMLVTGKIAASTPE
jgi:hypothetical protein